MCETEFAHRKNAPSLSYSAVAVKHYLSPGVGQSNTQFSAQPIPLESDQTR